ncbi:MULTISPECIES: c-type cytochrome biogenesis protein CcsB [Cellulosimicrobium]|uniref:C-type cytochrome biogenesis protein CcsB n=1 Tax=Cellulosimicrobium composti TaxID=2672572 RepID=A0A6N7ZL53_9MICO|nr:MULTISPECIES: c-type cytochrome biogenesis protein CcsB [Cellulosimicrobium]MTG90244.1 c-type cytochrome biogenesis protein CcsB [Cellulosimicrobium composti]QUC01898.1 c-type cytochrome biogenesis protein CcsB [Cellulosimicrobium cellulans]
MEISALSVLLVWSSATALVIALIAFAVDLAQRADPRGGQRVNPAATAVTMPRRAAGIAMATTWLATGLLVVAIVLRGMAAGRTPWANMYEFTLVGTCAALLAFLVLNARRDLRFAGTFVTGVAALFLVLALNAFYTPATGLFPALQSYWLVIHVGVAIGATGIFTVSAILSALQLLRDHRDEGGVVLGRRWWRWLDVMPEPAALESTSFRLNAVGFVAWTFTLIGGAIWAESAWGRYWGWDPKEVWTFIIWIVYAAYLHARTTRGWTGRRAAYLVLVGYSCVLFNFTVVNLLINGKHSYSGLTAG